MKKLLATLLILLVTTLGLAQSDLFTGDFAATGFDAEFASAVYGQTYTIQQEYIIDVYLDNALMQSFIGYASSTVTAFQKCGEGSCGITTAHGINLSYLNQHESITQAVEDMNKLGLNTDSISELESWLEQIDPSARVWLRYEVRATDKFWLLDYQDSKLKLPTFIYEVTFNQDNKWYALSEHITGLDVAIMWMPIQLNRSIDFCDRTDRAKIAEPVYSIGSPVGIPRQLSQGWVSDATPRSYGTGWEGLISVRLPSIGGQSGSMVFGRENCAIGILKGGIDDITLLVPSEKVNDFLRVIPKEAE